MIAEIQAALRRFSFALFICLKDAQCLLLRLRLYVNILSLVTKNREETSEKERD